LSFAGNQYPNYADKVITTRGDIIRGDSSGDRARYGVGAANTVLTSDGTDPAWAAAALAPTTTKGDISGFSTTQARIPISTNNYSLFADSAQALGLKWAASPTSVLTTTGDLLAASAANVLTRIAATTSGHVLTANGAGVLPTFQAAGGVTVTKVSSQMDATFSTTSLTDVDVTDNVATLPTIVGGLAMIIANAETRVSVAMYLHYYNMEIDSTIVSSRVPYSGNNSVPIRVPTPVTYVNSTSGDTVQMSIHTQAGTCYVFDEGGTVSGGGGTSIQILGVG